MTTPVSSRAQADDPVRALLTRVIDYAGFFPPASLDLDAVVANYASYRDSADAWMLGRLVVPAARLTEVAESAMRAGVETQDGKPWQISATLGVDARADMATVRAFNARHATTTASWFAAVDAVELRLDEESAIAELPLSLGIDLETFVEVPAQADVAGLIRAIRLIGTRAKIRMGGVTAEAFPSVEHVLRFIRTCVEMRVPFKATAGLHHAFTGAYPLTYESNASSAPMYGFLNVLLATAMVRGGIGDDDALALLLERDGATIARDGSQLTWREHVVTAPELVAARESALMSIGSCSFREPVDAVRALGLVGS
jgi:hypothetical protein